MSVVRIVKYEALIKDVNLCFSEGYCLSKFKRLVVEGEPEFSIALGLIYDYDKCNDYAKIIMDECHLEVDKYLGVECSTLSEALKESKGQIDLTKQLIEFYNKAENANEGYEFIFWALMILTVDKTDAENHLALICDFTKMLKITEDEFEDIIQIVKGVYNKASKEYTFKSETVPAVLGAICNMYER